VNRKVRSLVVFFLLLVFLSTGCDVSFAHVKHWSGHGRTSRHCAISPDGAKKAGVHHRKNYAQGVPRDRCGRIKRSAAAGAHFKKNHPCPSTGKTWGRCPGYIVDHIKPLKRGGSDAPSNMQWQTQAAAKAKDKWE
jgi:hypothetical protein